MAYDYWLVRNNQIDFGRKQSRINKARVLRFGGRVVRFILKYAVLFKEGDFAKFLSCKHKELGNRSPLLMMWTEGKRGESKVVRILILKRIESGDFSYIP